GVQGLQGRVPGQRRYGDLQGGISVALLRGPTTPAQRLCLRPDFLLGEARLAPTQPDKFPHADAAAAPGGQDHGWHGLSAPDPGLRTAAIQGVVPPARLPKRRGAPRDLMARYLQQLLPSRNRQSRRRGARSRRLSGRSPRVVAVLRPSALRL